MWTAGIDKKLLISKRKQEGRDESIRQAIEGALGVGKMRYGLDCVYEKLRITSETTLVVNMLVMNMEMILKDLYVLFLNAFQTSRVWSKIGYNCRITGKMSFSGNSK
ncbi:transposase [Marispirochaeta aestuarii]|uniref:transposase n=1 Tax=Marispirochaeta aestuarii TaxID=1963862 RepID=UPI0029C8A0CA|nr:transposase [Marispirochaeta aestuarii]